MNRHAVTIVATLGLVTSGALSTANAFAGQSPDARDANAAARSALSIPSVDMRSPDARDASSRAVTPASAPVSIADGRSPDTRDAANGVRFVSVPPVSVIEHPGSGGFQWGDAGIGAALLLAVLALAGVMTLQYRRRHLPGTPRTPLAG
jgi:hypothetical protein